MLITGHFEPLHWAIAGSLIGVFVVALQYFANRSFGVSTGFESVCALWSKRPYFQRDALGASGKWRFAFLSGLVLGGVLSALWAGGWSTTWSLGRLTPMPGAGPMAKTAMMVFGGFLIGFGTRMAGGCTSGHGIFGIATLQRSSFVTVFSFMAAGIVTANLIHRLF